jgi:PAS domain S-box-containing protein
MEKSSVMEVIVPDSAFRQVTQNSGVPIVFYNIKGVIIYANDAACKLYGYTQDELVGLSAAETIVGEVDVQSIINEILLKESWAGEIVQKKKDGTEFTASLTIGLIKDENDKPLLMSSSTFDVSDTKIMEVEIKKLNTDLGQWITERTEKLENAINKLETRDTEREVAYRELESFSYSVSHDLKAPLRIIGSYSNLLLKKHAGASDEEKRFVLQIEQNVKKMNALIDALLTLAKQDRKEIVKTIIDMNKLVEETISDLKNELPEYDTTSFVVNKLPELNSDYDLLKLVYANLISNAMKYSSKKEKPVVEIGSLVIDHENVYYVKDNGAGFDMKYADKLFHPFQRLHSESEFSGNGIGLTIVQKIITRLGGKIWAEAKAGEGATFYFKLISEAAKAQLPPQ